MCQFFFSTLLFFAMALAAPTGTTTDMSTEPVDGRPNLDAGMGAFRELALDSKGFIHVGGDGVVRSYDEDGNVVDHHCLNNTQLLEHASSIQDPDQFKELQSAWFDIDGCTVPEEQRWNPSDELKPGQFRDYVGPRSTNEPQQVKDNLLGKRTAPRCYNMFCYDTNSCRVMGCYACIQTVQNYRERKCVLRPSWYPQPYPLVNGCGKKKGKRSDCS